MIASRGEVSGFETPILLIFLRRPKAAGTLIIDIEREISRMPQSQLVSRP
jgi:hypothetical protein